MFYIYAGSDLVDAWKSKPNTPRKFERHTAISMNNGIYVLDGSRRMELYNPATDEWTVKNSVPVSGIKGCVSFENVLYVVG